MLYYIHYQETNGDFSINIYFRNEDFAAAEQLLINDNQPYIDIYKYGIPSDFAPIIITNDLRINMIYRKAFDLKEFKIYCGLKLEGNEKKPFYYQRESLNSKYAYILFESIENIINGKYNYLSLNDSKILSFISNTDNDSKINFQDLVNNDIIQAFEKDKNCLIFNNEDIYYDNLWNSLPISWKKLLIEKLPVGLFYNFTSDINIIIQIFDIEDLEIGLNYDLTQLKHFTKLKKLKISRINDIYSEEKNKIVKSEYLSHLLNLEYLNIESLTIDSLSFINHLKKLKNLNLSGILLKGQPEITVSYHILESLNLSSVNIKNFDFLKCFKNLKVLTIDKSNFENFELLLELNELTEIDLSRTNFSDINYLRNMNKLEKLQAYDTKISNIEKISYLKNLKFLDLSKNEITSYLENLYALENLEILLLNDCNLKTIPILKNIKTLQIKYNNDVDMDMINNYEKLIGYKIEQFDIL